MLRIVRLVSALTLLCVPNVWAQQSGSAGTDWHLKGVGHQTFGLSGHWFVAAWQIVNLRTVNANNFNGIVGLGYKGKRAWVEVMAQKQWGPKNLWFLDLRSQAQPTTTSSVFMEVAPSLTNHVVYTALILDVKARVHSKGGLGLETENIFKSPRNSLGGGPRVSYQVAQWSKSKITFALTYHFRPNEADVARMYLVYNGRF